MLWTFILTTTIYLIWKWIWARRRSQRTLGKMGIPGPQPGLLFGNIGEFGEMGMHACLEKWTNKYGKTFGFYEGAVPIVVSSDVELLKDIFIKEFHKFHSRKQFPLQNEHNEYQDMFTSNGNKWKRLRVTSTPSFSTGRMKQMSPLINNVVDRVLTVMDAHAKDGQPFNSHDVYQRMTLDVIACCAFGIDVNSLQDPRDLFLQHCREVNSIFEKPSTALILSSMVAVIFPSLMKAYQYIRPNVVPVHRQWFYETAKKIIQARKEKKSERVDFIQLMLDAQSGANLAEQELDNASKVINQLSDELPEKKQKWKKLSFKEMQAQCLLFLLAGFETTSTALAFVTYELVINPDVLKKLQEEIDEHFPEKDPRPDYVAVQQLPYLDMVICESLRLHPIAAIATTRQCREEVTIQGITFPVGVNVQANMKAVHMDPELWGPDDPLMFIPERFSPDNKARRHPMAWMPFGAGPRTCVGMRFALMEAKIALVRILRRYYIRSCDKTQVPIKVQKNSLQSPQDGVYVLISPRT